MALTQGRRYVGFSARSYIKQIDEQLIRASSPRVDWSPAELPSSQGRSQWRVISARLLAHTWTLVELMIFLAFIRRQRSVGHISGRFKASGTCSLSSDCKVAHWVHSCRPNFVDANYTVTRFVSLVTDRWSTFFRNMRLGRVTWWRIPAVLVDLRTNFHPDLLGAKSLIVELIIGCRLV